MLRKGDKIYILTLLSLAAFLIMKVQRGFSASEEQGGLWNIIQGIYAVFGLYQCFKLKDSCLRFSMIRRYKTFVFTIWVMSFFVMLFTIDFGVNSLFRFIMIPDGFLCFMVFYRIGLTNDIRKYPYILYITFLIIVYILYTSMRTYYYVLDDDKGAVADVYYIVGLLPIIFIYTPKKLRILPFLLTSIAVMMSGKRVGFLALSVILVLYFLSNDSDYRKSFISKLLVFVTLFSVLYFVVVSFSEMFDLQMFERLERLEEDGGSGRAEKWEAVWNVTSSEQSIWPLLLGHGYGAAYNQLRGHVHNDFLEFFYNYGVIAFVLYISFFVSMVRECILMYHIHFTYAREFMVAVVISIFLAMFSFYAIDCTHITCCSVSLGLILAEWYKFQIRNKL
ncbi:MAG: O-antigen ligase family protein [Paludibacteraceae bacterium]|nr:O-antigen ligase family protein [Paludibacteraceae bacterium]